METLNRSQKTQIHVLSAVIAIVQVLDIVVHVANDMLEPIRILASLLIFVWLGIVLSNRFDHMKARVDSIFVGGYILLNGIFVAMEGFTNPDNGGQFRTVLFVLVGITVALSLWLPREIPKSQNFHEIN